MPVEEEHITVTKPSDIAAGAKAVSVAVKNGMKQMGATNCTKSYLKLNQPEGYDCPSCAWPDPMPGDRSSIAEYCENGAKAVAEEATTKRADLAFWKKHSINELMTWSELKLGKAGRITHPMILEEGNTHYRPIEWDDAFELIGKQLNALDSPDEAIFYTSGRTTNEAAYLYQLFAKMYGTNNMPDCSNMCHESTGVALSDTIGIGKGTVTLEDFYTSELIIVIGQNPGTNHPRMMSALQKCKRNGGKIIDINPLKETGLKSFKNPQEVRGWIGSATTLSDLHIPVKINGDLALLKAVLCLLLKEEEKRPGKVFDHTFIKQHTQGYNELITHLEQQDIEQLANDCNIPLQDIQKITDLIANSKTMIICWAMGITQHENSVATINEIINLLLITGNMGVAGAGACPVRGHSNVQGDRTVGVWEKVKPALRASLEANYHFKVPEKEGYNVRHAITAMYENRASVFVSMGGNLLLAGPDTDYTAQAMRNCDLTVMISTKPNRNHLVTGKTALILPCLGRTEKDMQGNQQQFVSVENSMGIVHKSIGVLEPASPHLLSEPDIVARIAMSTLGKDAPFNFVDCIANYDLIRDEIEQNVSGFDNYNERVRKAGGFYLPNGARERKFDTDTRKAKLTINPSEVINLNTDEYLLSTMRSHDQFNTTIYGNDDRYRGIHNGRRVLFMNKQDIQQAGFKDGDLVNISSYYNDIKRTAPKFLIVTYDIPRKCLAAYFPETNAVIPIDYYAKKSDCPASKSVVVKLEMI